MKEKAAVREKKLEKRKRERVDAVNNFSCSCVCFISL